MSNEEIPLKEDVLYLLEPSETFMTSGRSTMEGHASDSIVVFCIDTSGSMGVTTEVCTQSVENNRDKVNINNYRDSREF